MFRLGISLCICVFFFAFANLAMADSVWRITSLDWPPYSDSSADLQGNSIHKLRALLKEEGIELVVEFFPWARAQEVAKQEGYVGYFPAWPEEVSDGFSASLPVDWSEIGVLTADSNLTWISLEALFNNKIGLIMTYKYPEVIAKLAKSKSENVDSTPNELSLLKKLSDRRFKTAITDPTVMHFLAAREGIKNIKTLKILEQKALVLAFRNCPENMKRLKLLNEVITR